MRGGARALAVRSGVLRFAVRDGARPLAVRDGVCGLAVRGGAREVSGRVGARDVGLRDSSREPGPALSQAGVRRRRQRRAVVVEAPGCRAHLVQGGTGAAASADLGPGPLGLLHRVQPYEIVQGPAFGVPRGQFGHRQVGPGEQVVAGQVAEVATGLVVGQVEQDGGGGGRDVRARGRGEQAQGTGRGLGQAPVGQVEAGPDRQRPPLRVVLVEREGVQPVAGLPQQVRVRRERQGGVRAQQRGRDAQRERQPAAQLRQFERARGVRGAPRVLGVPGPQSRVEYRHGFLRRQRAEGHAVGGQRGQRLAGGDQGAVRCPRQQRAVPAGPAGVVQDHQQRCPSRGQLVQQPLPGVQGAVLGAGQLPGGHAHGAQQPVRDRARAHRLPGAVAPQVGVDGTTGEPAPAPRLVCRVQRQRGLAHPAHARDRRDDDGGRVRRVRPVRVQVA
ncbi:hypothetical protein [Streptomyces sp. CC224B]|uniref:hypothetical protein n=1 Tax=Streptomyces sp. CC224B TaxID=3044571 RepID=UPI0024A9128B|nr:hypothetical protein [Streptomyces sp. CC224B]